jgi:hypothetical protein
MMLKSAGRMTLGACEVMYAQCQVQSFGSTYEISQTKCTYNQQVYCYATLSHASQVRALPVTSTCTTRHFHLTVSSSWLLVAQVVVLSSELPVTGLVSRRQLIEDRDKFQK